MQKNSHCSVNYREVSKTRTKESLKCHPINVVNAAAVFFSVLAVSEPSDTAPVFMSLLPLSAAFQDVHMPGSIC